MLLKKRAAFLPLLLACFFLFAQHSFAGTPSPFGRKALDERFSIGFHLSQVSLENNLLFFSHLSYGLNSRMALNGHFSFENYPFDTYTGIDLRAVLLNGQKIKLDAYLGAHRGGLGNGYDAGMICNLDIFSSLGLVAAVDADFFTDKNNDGSPVHFIAGIDFPIARNMGLILNAEFALNRAAYKGFSGGFIFFL